MLIVVPDVLSAAELETVRRTVRDGDFLDGRGTAGPQTVGRKNNLQTDRKSERLASVQAMITAALERNNLFKAAIAPRRIIPPRFNLYKQGMYYGNHVDNAVMGDSAAPIRVDCSFTLFISGPDEYDGGELVIASSFGPATFKLPAGSLVAYPTYFYHEVKPVTRGERLCCISWLQSMIRDPNQREIIFELALAADRMSRMRAPESKAALEHLERARKNLLRSWVEI
mgnify:CR=1 FL=1